MEIKIISVSINAESGIIGNVQANTSCSISMIDQSHVAEYKQTTLDGTIKAEEFSENILVEGLGESKAKPFDRFVSRNVVLEVCQVKKQSSSILYDADHSHFKPVTIFMRVLEGGILEAGDTLHYVPKVFNAKLITLSDRASKGIYEDKSGALIANKLQAYFEEIGWDLIIDKQIIPDSREDLLAQINDATQNNYDIIITTGGTGIGSRDITLSVVKPLLDHEIPGIMEHIRMKYGSIKPNALLSAGIAGTIDASIIYTLPGSVKAVAEYMEEILSTLQHLIFMKADMDVH